VTAGHAITKMTMEPSHPHFRYRSAGIPEGSTGRSFLSLITRTRYETFTDLGRTEIHVVPVVVRCLLLADFVEKLAGLAAHPPFPVFRRRRYAITPRVTARGVD
jgi:hypothetical protein